MKDFDWTKFTRKVAVKAKLQDIYNAWAKASEIEKWFLSNADYFDINKRAVTKTNLIEKGFTYEWGWFLFEPIEKGQITNANGKDYIQFTFAGNCLVDINLKEHGEYIIVELTQKNIPTDDESKKGIRLGCDNGWSFFLVNLKSVYEGGLDLRNKNPELKAMINS